MVFLRRITVLCVVIACCGSTARAQGAPEKPKPDAQFGNWLFKTPDPKVWKRTEKNGALVFSADEPAGDFSTLTLFADAKAEASFTAQFNAAVAADQSAKDTVKIEADSGAKPSKAAEGFDVLTRSLRSETHAFHTFHIYVGGNNGGHFNLAAFQTSSESSWKQYAAQASQFMLSLKLASSLTPLQVAQYLGQPDPASAPTLPGLDDAGTANDATAAAAPPTLDADVTPPSPPAPPPTAKAEASTPAPAAAVTLPEVKVPDRPLNKSPIVVNNAVTQRNGAPINGLKLSQHDFEIYCPSITVAPNGTIHVAFVEKHKVTYALAVYHRSSSDGGKTWTDAKNLSEDMPQIGVGRCCVLADAAGRVYVIWRAGLGINFQASPNIGGANQSNIVFRCLENGRWSKIKPVNTPGSTSTQDDGALSYFAAIDAAGHAQVVWNALPNKWHEELVHVSGTYHQSIAGVGAGLVFQSTLEGATASPQREIFLTPTGGMDPPNTYNMHCDGLDALNGYVDSNGSPHFLAEVKRTWDDSLRNKSYYELIEGGKIGPSLDLPPLSYHAWNDVPTLLVDAAGRQHAIVLYPSGEHPNVRDYLLGSDDDPVVIRQTQGVQGSLQGFQAYQGPNGRMVAIMQMNDTADRANGETYVSVSTGQGWSTPINVTNNLGRQSWTHKRVGAAAGVGIEKSYYPGPAAAAFDHDGHLLLLMVNNEYASYAITTLGAITSSGDSSIPTLQFLRF